MRRLPVLGMALMAMLAACGTRINGNSPGYGPQALRSAANGQVNGAQNQTAGDQNANTASALDNGIGTATGPAASNDNASAGAATNTATGAANSNTGAVSNAANTSPIVLAAVGTRTGIVGAQGAGFWASLDAWVKTVNAAGGVSGHQIKMITADDGADPGRNGAEVRQIIDSDHPVAFVGSYAPLSFSGGLPAIEAAGLPAIAGDSGEAGWFSSANAFPIMGADLPEGTAGGKFACGLPQRRAAIYYVQEIDFGRRIADLFAKYWTACGKQVVAKTGISLGQPDFTAEVLQASSNHADVVVVYTDISGCLRFYKAAESQNYKPLWFTASSCYNSQAALFKDETAHNLYSTTNIEPPTSSIPAMVALRNGMAKYEPNANLVDGVMTRGWANGLLFQAAVAAAGGKYDPASLIAGLHAMHGETLGGITAPLTFPPGPHPQVPCGKVSFFDGTAYSLVTPSFVCG